MFHSLYNRQKSGNAALAEDTRSRVFASWPASFMDGLTLVDAERWELEVTGLVERPQVFRLKDLMTFTRIQQNRRLVFADGWTFRAQWEGFVISELLHRVGAQPEARYLYQTNLAGQVECLPIQDLITQRSLFCLRVDGRPLPSLYGGPLRLMVFDRYAHKGLCQLARLELAELPIPGHWAGKGYDAEARITPGTYYAADLQVMQTVRTPGEITQW